MISLSNRCARSEITVIPDNWDINIEKASDRMIKSLLKKKWKIYYRYYDPTFKNDPKKWGKMIPIRGTNGFKDLSQRQAATRVLLEAEKDKLDTQLYNPITGIYHTVI